MNSLQINNVMLKNKYTKNKFKGVFACDKLPKNKINKPSCFIINTDPASLPGTHWVAVYFPKRGYADYFDSFGMKPNIKSILKFISHNSVKYNYNSKQLQNIFSPVCGNYCCEYLLHKCQGRTNSKFFNKYKINDTPKNDILTVKNFKTHFGNKRRCLKK